MDEILEGYRTFTALAAEVNTPGGSGIMSRYGTGAVSSGTDNQREEELAAPPTRSGTLSDYAPQQHQLAKAEQLREGGAVVVRGGRRGPGVPYFDPASDPVMVDALRLLFAKEGNYVQDLVSTSCLLHL